MNGKNLSFEYLSKLFKIDSDGNLCRRFAVKKAKAGLVVGKPDHLGYMSIYQDNKRLKVHRIAYCVNSGEDLLGSFEIDHIDGNPSNNNVANLRKCNRVENQQNSGANKNNSLGYKGVCLHKKTGKYFGRWMYNRKFYSTKYHLLPIDAYNELLDIKSKFKSEFINGEEMK
ncbi:hypothetical protein [Escherichia phage vB_EcoS_IME542]|uniref:HNH nuclease domain-containing protein n=1 Tax=Escherichia phage vB_EcoS_IME542 TaxID=2507711 RepID=A0A410T644_9CAUD|nr:hypothetical protein HOV01_gp70 [Escherichia phage vB_EcoS_IME542]QAU04442.1 hypothetical protein [Escherichia phage vB_EcoS_IME542]